MLVGALAALSLVSNVLENSAVLFNILIRSDPSNDIEDKFTTKQHFSPELTVCYKN